MDSPSRIPASGVEPDRNRKWRNLWLLAVVELLSISVWFSASAVIPQLTAEWRLSGGQQSWMTMSVQLGFVVGTLLSAVFNLADRIPLKVLLAVSSFLAALFTAAVALLAPGPEAAFLLRFLTGMTLAGVYPPGMKLAASWCGKDRGLGMGLLVGALTAGSALPHLLSALPLWAGSFHLPGWRSVLLFASGLALVAAVVALSALEPGPLLPHSARFNWKFAGRIFTDRSLRLANFGYLGHMWELYAMWTWAPVFLLSIYGRAGWPESGARLAGFATIAVGALGCVAAGLWADRWGRTLLTTLAMAVSGCCALATGFVSGLPVLATILSLVWGMSIVADSAQFSAAVSELGDRNYVGTVLTMQTCTGFLLTLVTIRLVPLITAHAGWGWAFALLAPGPVFGIWNMLRLRSLPEAVRMASGNR